MASTLARSLVDLLGVVIGKINHSKTRSRPSRGAQKAFAETEASGDMTAYLDKLGNSLSPKMQRPLADAKKRQQRGTS